MILILSRGRSESTTEEIERINYLGGECIRINGDELKKRLQRKSRLRYQILRILIILNLYIIINSLI